jgi:hypothetical protein
MGVRVSKKALSDLLRSVLFEAVPSAGAGGSSQSRTMAAGDFTTGTGGRAGQFDRPLKQQSIPGAELESTIPEEVPVHASEMMGVQLAEERPPIEDPEYVPTNVAQLSLAASAIAQQVPQEQVSYFYHQLQRTLDNAQGRESSGETSEAAEEVETEEVNVETVEESLRQALRQVIKEQDDPEGVAQDGASYRELQPITGHRAPSGVRQYIGRSVERLGYMQGIDPDDVDELIAYGVLEFIDLLADSGSVDDEDAMELKMNPHHVEELDFFRNFLVDAIVLPAFQQVKRNAKKEVAAQLEKVGIPSTLHDRIKDFVVDDPDHDEQKLLSNIKTDAVTAGEDIAAIDSLAATLSAELQNLYAIAELQPTILDIAQKKWGARNVNDKLRIMDKARSKGSGTADSV